MTLLDLEHLYTYDYCKGLWARDWSTANDIPIGAKLMTLLYYRLMLHSKFGWDTFKGYLWTWEALLGGMYSAETDWNGAVNTYKGAYVFEYSSDSETRDFWLKAGHKPILPEDFKYGKDDRFDLWGVFIGKDSKGDPVTITGSNGSEYVTMINPKYDEKTKKNNGKVVIQQSWHDDMSVYERVKKTDDKGNVTYTIKDHGYNSSNLTSRAVINFYVSLQMEIGSGFKGLMEQYQNEISFSSSHDVNVREAEHINNLPKKYVDWSEYENNTPESGKKNYKYPPDFDKIPRDEWESIIIKHVGGSKMNYNPDTKPFIGSNWEPEDPNNIEEEKDEIHQNAARWEVEHAIQDVDWLEDIIYWEIQDFYEENDWKPCTYTFLFGNLQKHLKAKEKSDENWNMGCGITLIPPWSEQTGDDPEDVIKHPIEIYRGGGGYCSSVGYYSSKKFGGIPATNWFGQYLDYRYAEDYKGYIDYHTWYVGTSRWFASGGDEPCPDGEPFKSTYYSYNGDEDVYYTEVWGDKITKHVEQDRYDFSDFDHEPDYEWDPELSSEANLSNQQEVISNNIRRDLEKQVLIDAGIKDNDLIYNFKVSKGSRIYQITNGNGNYEPKMRTSFTNDFGMWGLDGSNSTNFIEWNIPKKFKIQYGGYVLPPLSDIRVITNTKTVKLSSIDDIYPEVLLENKRNACIDYEVSNMTPQKLIPPSIEVKETIYERYDELFEWDDIFEEYRGTGEFEGSGESIQVYGFNVEPYNPNDENGNPKQSYTPRSHTGNYITAQIKTYPKKNTSLQW